MRVWLAPPSFAGQAFAAVPWPRAPARASVRVGCEPAPSLTLSRVSAAREAPLSPLLTAPFRFGVLAFAVRGFTLARGVLTPSAIVAVPFLAFAARLSLISPAAKLIFLVLFVT